MNKKDEYIKYTLRKDAEISESANKIFEEFKKGVVNMEEKNISNKKTKNYKKIISIAASIVIVILFSVSGYAALTGKIGGRPIFEDWLGVKFSKAYNDYIVPVENQVLESNGTSVELVSTVCDDGYVVLEFNVILSEEDKSKLGEMTKNEYFHDLYLSFNEETENSLSNNYNLIIDDKEYWVRPRSLQTVIDISKNEYKVYQAYFLTDKELGENKEFTITLNNVIIHSYLTGDCVNLDGQFNVKVSKEKSIENSKIINPNLEQVSYKKMNINLDKITVTPLQVVAQTTSEINDVSLDSLSITSHEDYIGLKEYKVYDENNNELSNSSYEVKRTIVYEDGTTEEWEGGDIEFDKEFKNAKMILKDYIAIEKTDNLKQINIVPYIREVINENGDEKEVYLDGYCIDLTNSDNSYMIDNSQEINSSNENINSEKSQNSNSEMDFELLGTENTNIVSQDLLGTWQYDYTIMYDDNGGKEQLSLTEAYGSGALMTENTLVFYSNGKYKGGVMGVTDQEISNEGTYKINSNGNITLSELSNKKCNYSKTDNTIKLSSSDGKWIDVFTQQTSNQELDEYQIEVAESLKRYKNEIIGTWELDHLSYRNGGDFSKSDYASKGAYVNTVTFYEDGTCEINDIVGVYNTCAVNTDIVEVEEGTNKLKGTYEFDENAELHFVICLCGFNKEFFFSNREDGQIDLCAEDFNEELFYIYKKVK